MAECEVILERALTLVGRRGSYRRGVAFGQAMPTEMIFAGNPTEVVLEGGFRPYVDVVAREGLGPHGMIGYGDVQRQLDALCSHLAIPCIDCT